MKFDPPEDLVIPPASLQRLVSLAPDRDLLLTAKLCFHCHVQPRELKSLTITSVLWREALPVQLCIRGPVSGTCPKPRYIPLYAPDADTVKALLPRACSGPLLSCADPWGRLRRFGLKIGVELTSLATRSSCFLYRYVSGVPLDWVANLSGIEIPWWQRKRLWLPIPGEQINAYYAVRFDLARIEALPQRIPSPQRHRPMEMAKKKAA